MSEQSRPTAAALHAEVRSMTTALGVVTDGISALEDRLDSIERSNHEIREALTGNGFGSHFGLIHRTGEVEKAQVALQAEVHALRAETRDRWNRIKWTTAGIGIGAGVGGGSLVAMALKLVNGGG